MLCCSRAYNTPLVFWFLFLHLIGIKRLVYSGNRVFYSKSCYIAQKAVSISSKCTFCAGSGNYRMTFCSLCTISLLSLLRVAYTIFTVSDNWWVSVRSITTSTVHQPSSISQNSVQHPSVKFKYTVSFVFKYFCRLNAKLVAQPWLLLCVISCINLFRRHSVPCDSLLLFFWGVHSDLLICHSLVLLVSGYKYVCWRGSCQVRRHQFLV